MTATEIYHGILDHAGTIREANGTLFVQPTAIAKQFAPHIILVKSELVEICRWRDAAKCTAPGRVHNCIFCMTAQPQWRAVKDKFDLRQCKDCGRWFSFTIKSQHEH